MLKMRQPDLHRAQALMTEALAICDANGQTLAAARLQWALDTLPQSGAWTKSDQARSPEAEVLGCADNKMVMDGYPHRAAGVRQASGESDISITR